MSTKGNPAIIKRGAFAGAAKPEVRPLLPATTAEKANRIDHALRIERDHQRRQIGGERALRLSNVLNGIIQNEDVDTKARLFDLIVGNETKDAALQSLEDAGFQEGRPEPERDLRGVIRPGRPFIR